MRPMLQNVIIDAGTKRETPDRNPNRWRRPTTNVRSRDATKESLSLRDCDAPELEPLSCHHRFSSTPLIAQ